MIIAVDFDGTIVEHAYPRIGKPIPFAIEVLKKLQQEEHHILLLWSVREGDTLQDAVNYCKQNGLQFYAVNSNYPEEEPADTPRKLNADLYIDDKNIGGIPDWGVIYQMLKSGNLNYESPDNFFENKPQRKKNFFTQLGEAWDKARGYRY
jgi:hydroxymethylpyrimidine pyrophosphatase-like HAD family hydrolase